MSANRETWLLNAVSVLRDGIFERRCVAIPELKLSVGLPHARNQRTIKIQYFPPDMSADHVAQVFVSPLLEDGSLIIGQLYGMLKEMFCPPLHAAYNNLPIFTQDLSNQFIEALGPYPSAALKLPEVEKQTTRMLKLVCPACGYTCRATQRWTSKGLPRCYCSNTKFKVERKGAHEKNESTNDEIPF